MLGFQGVGIEQLREEAHPEAGHHDGADAAQQHGRDGSEEGGSGSGLEFAELVGGADEKRVDRGHPSPHLVRGPELNERRPDHHADHVGRSQHQEGSQRQRQRR